MLKFIFLFLAVLFTISDLYKLVINIKRDGTKIKKEKVYVWGTAFLWTGYLIVYL